MLKNVIRKSSVLIIRGRDNSCLSISAKAQGKEYEGTIRRQLSIYMKEQRPKQKPEGSIFLDF
jgi:hypothetical protein